jgi:hypothetical protein
MICLHCEHPNPNGYAERCKSCRKPLSEAPVVKEKPKVAKVAKKVKKAKVSKKA